MPWRTSGPLVGGDFEVGAGAAGTRLDVYLAHAMGLSRAQVRRLLERGQVRVAERVAALDDKGRTLATGERVEVEAFVPTKAQRPPSEPDAPLRILAQGPGWLAVDKEPGRAVHPLREDERGTLLGAVVARVPEILGVGEKGLRSGVVHRLDLPTSGVVLFATHEARWRALRSAFTERRVDKRYRALLLGEPPERGRLDLRLRVASHRPARVRVVEGGAPARGSRRARLRWRVEAQLGSAALVAVELETGFLHQIRASFAHLGHPVLGDAAYGFDADAFPAPVPRTMLHAARIEVDDVCAESPLPGDFEALCDRLRGG